MKLLQSPQSIFLPLLFAALLAACSPASSTQPTASPLPTGAPCPITPLHTDFWEQVPSVAGESPVWITSRGQSPWSALGPDVLPPTSGAPPFDLAKSTKYALFVDKAVAGDLKVTGKRLDGDGKVYFNLEGSMERVDEATLRLLDVPPDSLLIPAAHLSANYPEPPGKSNHGLGVIFPSPGCYQFLFEIDQHTVEVILEILDS